MQFAFWRLPVVTLPTSLDQWLLIGRALFLIFSFVLAAMTFSAWRRETLRQGEIARTEHTDLGKRLDTLDARLVAMRQALAHVSETFERSGRTDPGSQRVLAGYPIAIRLARSGARAQELVASCGLSASEAELVCRLHGSARAVNA
jgi:Protein of unknown function (DUF2802)